MSDKIEHQHRDLIEACKEGNRQAQYDLYHLYVDAMYNTCLRMVQHQSDAEDIVQEAFVKAFTGLESFAYKSTFGAWLKRIVINHSMNFLTKKKLAISNVEKIPEPVHVVESTRSAKCLHLEDVKKGIAMLSRGYQQIISLYLLEGYDHAEISQIAGISVSTSKSQYHRAKKKLVEIINEELWMK